MASNSIYSEIERLNTIDSSYQRRREMESMPGDQQFTASVHIKEIERFYGYIREDGYRDGKAIIGLLDGTDQELKLVFPQDMNDTVDSWREGQEVRLQVSFHEFDSAYNRYQVLVRKLGDDADNTVDTSTKNEANPESLTPTDRTTVTANDLQDSTAEAGPYDVQTEESVLESELKDNSEVETSEPMEPEPEPET